MARKSSGRAAQASPHAGIALYPLPPDAFDPAEAVDADLLRFGLPVPREAGSNSAAVAFRRAFVRKRHGAPALRFAPALQLTGGPPPVRIVAIAAPEPRPAQKSMNWSGGYVTPRDGCSLVSVMANWTVPRVYRPPGSTASESQSSTWIGLDGQKFYRDSSLPQVGTRQRWLTQPTPRADYSAWFQWWARGLDLPIWDLMLPVDAGDEISAILTVLDAGTVRCNLKNVSKGIILQAFDASAPDGLRISGATAEWIMERPSPMGSDGWETYELPVFRPFDFTACLAEAAASGSPELREHDLELARLIRMYAIDGDPARVLTLSTARRVLGPPQRLTMSYVAE